MRLLFAATAALVGTVLATPLEERATNQVFALGAADDPTNIQDGIGPGQDVYKMYTGDGSAAQGWPVVAQWVSFEDMFNANKGIMRASCVNLGPDSGPNNSEDEIGQIWNAVQSAAFQTHVDHRFIFAVLLQESKGCVRVRTTANPIPNPGLMQAHDGAFSCNMNGVLQVPCPPAQIFGQVLDGVGGTASGDGLAAILNGLGRADAQSYYQAARLYNSGSIAVSKNLDDGGMSTNCYVSDIANRLTGWVWAPSGCSM